MTPLHPRLFNKRGGGKKQHEVLVFATKGGFSQKPVTRMVTKFLK